MKQKIVKTCDTFDHQNYALMNCITNCHEGSITLYIFQTAFIDLRLSIYRVSHNIGTRINEFLL